MPGPRPPDERTEHMTGFLARRERFERVGSTNDVVLEWLTTGTPEVCLAVADEQTAGRGRSGRRWIAPPGAALLLSLGFRPAWLEPGEVWRLPAVASLAMADAAEAVAALEPGTVRLKWPNDLVVEAVPGGLRKLAGVLGETDGLGSDDPRVVVGIGINVDWAPDTIPAEVIDTMTSLRAVADGRAVPRETLLGAFLARLEPGIVALRAGHFDATGWSERQVTTGRMVRLEAPTGSETALALGVDGTTGALIVADAAAATAERHVVVGEITHVRLAEPAAAGV